MRYVLSALYIIRHCPDKNTVQNYNYPSKRFVFFKENTISWLHSSIGWTGCIYGEKSIRPKKRKGGLPVTDIQLTSDCQLTVSRQSSGWKWQFWVAVFVSGNTADY